LWRRLLDHVTDIELQLTNMDIRFEGDLPMAEGVAPAGTPVQSRQVE
jgi:hypothetical protein